MMKAFEQRERFAARTENEMHDWQEIWDQFNRDFHAVHESAQIENRSIELVERQVQQSQQKRSRLEAELKTLDTSPQTREIEALEQNSEAKNQEHAATLEQVRFRRSEGV
jgi:hypothetical protein